MVNTVSVGILPVILPNMSPNKTIVKKKLALLERNISFLQAYAKMPKSVFVEDFTVSGAALHYMVESIEIIVDIGMHILSEDFNEQANSYIDAILQLGQKKIVPKKFADDNQTMARFRNRIIHVYGDVDLRLVYDFLKDSPKIFKKFAVYYLKYLEK